MLTRRFNYFILTGLMLIYFFSCDSNKKSTDSVELDSLLVTYQALNDSVDRNWAVMIADDDDKHLLMRRLLLEVSYTNNYNSEKFDELNGMIDDLKALRYDQKSMSDSDSIDEYDSATFALSDEIILFARSHPRFEDFPLMEELISDINAKNNYILLHRVHYDNWAKELNAFIMANKDMLLLSDPSIESESMPLFQLPS